MISPSLLTGATLLTFEKTQDATLVVVTGGGILLGTGIFVAVLCCICIILFSSRHL